MVDMVSTPSVTVVNSPEAAASEVASSVWEAASEEEVVSLVEAVLSEEAPQAVTLSTMPAASRTERSFFMCITLFLYSVLFFSLVSGGSGPAGISPSIMLYLFIVNE